MYKKILASCLVCIFCFFNTCVATESIYVWSNASSVTTSTNETKKVEENTLKLEAGSAILIEQNSGKVLYQHNPHEKLRPASVTKVMTILLIMEALDSGKITLEDKIACSENASAMGGSQIWLDVRETLSVHDMLKAICVVSANDCTVAMAEHLAGSQEAFVAQMNKRAKELGMKDTTFKNCHGLDEDGHVTSSYDIALMSRELLTKHPKITEYTTIWMDSLRDGKSQLVNTNKLIRNYSGATGLKTGSTATALYNLSASATKNDLSLIAVIMKAPTTKVRFEEAIKLLDYGFNNYSYKQFGNTGETVKTINVDKGVKTTINAVLESSCGALVKKGQNKELVQNITLEETVRAPINKGQKLGEITYTIEGEIVGQSTIVAQEGVDKITLWNMTTHLYKNWYLLSR